MSRNEDRLGSPAVAQDSTPPSTAGLSFSTPTEFIDLPSKGKYYPEEHPLHNETQMEIRYMTAKDEDTLTSKTLIRKGVAVDRFLQNVIVDKRIHLDTLVVGDKNALVVATRINGYGADYKARVTCPGCAQNFEHEFNLEEASVPNETNLVEGTKETPNGTFLVTLPLMKCEVEVRLLNGQDEKYLSQLATTRKKHKLGETRLTEQFKLFIVAVNGNTDKHTISQLVDNMPARDSRHLRYVYAQAVPNIDLTQEVLCELCGAEALLEVPFSTEFFWPKR